MYVYGITGKIGDCMDVAVDMALSDFGIVLLLVDEWLVLGFVLFCFGGGMEMVVESILEN